MAKVKRRKASSSTAAKKIEKRSKRNTCALDEDERVEFLDSGCSPLNLALSGTVTGGWARGRIFNIVGDGSSGKTLLALELAAYFYYYIKSRKTTLFPKVKKVRVIYNNVETVMDFPVKKMYKKPFVNGIIWRSTKTAEAFGRDVGREIMKMNKGTAVLYIVDSLDALKSSASEKRFKKAIKEDKDEDGAYKGAEKAGYFSQSFFNNICDLMDGKDFSLCIISQVRKAIGVTFGEKEYRTGGKALDFFTHQVAWIRRVKDLEKTIKGDKRTYGTVGEAKIKRSKVSKPKRVAPFHIIYDRGLDDIRSTADAFFKKKKPSWKIGKKKKNFRSIEDFILYIEKNNLEEAFKKQLDDYWQAVESQLVKPLKKRKPRFE